jgi:hypothetical protein
MAAPSYTTDLTLIHDCQTATGWAEPTATGWTSINAITGGETDYYIQGSACNSATVKSGVGGIVYDATSITVPTDGAILLWLKWDAPNCLYTETNGGIRFIVGSSLSAFYAWKMGGIDTYTYGGWINIACDPSQTPDYTVSTPTSIVRYMGWAYYAYAGVPTKGNPYGVDVLRYGRCESRFSGGDLANGYATFNGFASINDLQDNRWGLIQSVAGGFLVKGLIVFGYTSAVDFRDSNKNIIIDNTKKVSANFNTFEVRQTTSRIDFIAITISSLGTVSRGRWITTDNATQNITNCIFVDMGTFGYASNSTITGTTFRRCGLVTQNSSVISKSTFDSTNDDIRALLSNNPSNVSNCTFSSSGTKHAIELASACAGNTYNLSGHTFSGYATSDGTTGNEVLYNNSGGTVTLNVFDITGTLSIRNGTGASTILVVSPVSCSITVKDISTGNNIQSARVLITTSSGGPLPYQASVTITRSGSVATVTHSNHGLSTNHKVLISGSEQTEYNGVKTITYIDSSNYSFTVSGTPVTPATGTIKSTFVLIDGETDVNGYISYSGSYTSNQPIVGRVRKYSFGSYYKTSPITGIVDSTNGFSTIIQLIPDV